MDIRNIYKKFKSTVYYDNSFLHLKKKLADFETNLSFENDLNNIESIIKGHSEEIDIWLNKIGILVIPKKFANKDCTENFIINDFNKGYYKLESFNYLIDCPIELHLFCFYWVLKFGKILEKDYMEFNYANSMYDDTNSTLKTFKPYFKQYSNWRDNGIFEAQRLHSEKKDSAILMLDIKSYYYNVNFDFEILNENIERALDKKDIDEYKRITLLIEKIFIKYNNLLRNYLTNNSNNITLPLGLSISTIFANWFLLEMDKKIVECLKPSYYGRYVDDIMIVLNNYSIINQDLINIESFVEENFIKYYEIFKKNESDKSYTLNTSNCKVINKNSKIEIQESKMKLYILKKDGTPALLEKFLDNIKSNNSEFRFLPEEDRIVSEFFNDSYSILYNDSHNKLRSIDEFKGNKYGVSKYLAKIIFSSKNWEDNSATLDSLIFQLTSFFKGQNALEYYQLWNKVFTFFIVNYRFKDLINFYNYIEANIEKISTNDTHNSIKIFLLDYLKYSLSLASALNYDSIKNHKEKEELLIFAKNFRECNLIIHTYLDLPLITYVEEASAFKNIISIQNEISKDDKLELKIDKNKVLLSPKYLHFHEYQHLELFREIITWDKGDFGKYLNNSISSFCHYDDSSSKDKNKNFENFITDESSNIVKISIPSTEKKKKLKVGVANIIIKKENIKAAYLENSNLGRTRFIKLIKLLNNIEKLDCDMIVLPEVSIPFKWLGLLVKFSQKHQKSLVFGLEHIINRNKFALNILVTILPFKINNLKYTFTNARLKNHYSPFEIHELRGYRYKIPKLDTFKYNLFNWNGLSFTCFNCFELADISHRSLFKSKIDFLTASEYNRDTNYFSNIVESVTRDIHCYFIQSNSSDFGDSRITKPSKSHSKDILRLKGGLNDTVLIGELNIEKLRDFQVKEYELQKEDNSYKPTPPNFNYQEVEKRNKT